MFNFIAKEVSMKQSKILFASLFLSCCLAFAHGAIYAKTPGEKVDSALDKAKEVYNDAKEKTKDAYNDAKDKLSDAKDKAKEKTDSARDKLGDKIKP